LTRSHVGGYLSIDVLVNYAVSIFSILTMNSAGGLFATCVPTPQTALRHLL